MRNYMASVMALIVVAYGCMAQQAPSMVVNIPFDFKADMNLVPAGTYEVKPNDEGTHMQLRNMKTDQRYIARVLTNLAPRGSDRSLVAFDVEGQTRYLSEVHIAGIDGFAIEAVTGKHTHVTIQAEK
jgi:hypothetical protein